MRVRRIATSGFRNLVPGVVEVDAPLVAIWGANGQGKTNLLEAIGILGTLKSFRTHRPAEVVCEGQQSARVEGLTVGENTTRRFQWAWGPEGRVLRREDRVVDSVDWLRTLRATTFAPGDVALVRGEPALRRSLLDRAVLTLDPGYLVVARDFRRVIDQKSALLRAGRGSTAEFDVLDLQLAELGTRMTLRRRAAVEALAAPFADYYRQFSKEEGAAVRYRAVLGEGDGAELQGRYHGQLTEGRVREQEARRILGGPQRDDLEFRIGTADARRQASTGQTRSLVLAWKLAEVAVAGGAGESPLFLLDDLGSELDPNRTEGLVHLLHSLGAQVFVTTTDRRFLPASVDALLLEVVAGRVRG